MSRTHSPHSPNRAGRADCRRITARTGRQPSPVWMLTLLTSTMLR